MNGTIRQLTCRYRLPAAAGGPAAVARLDRLAVRQVPQALAEALEQALGDDEAVYVIRRVDVQLRWAGEPSDTGLGSAWGERLASSVLRALASGDGVVRFAGEADHAAHFLADLVGGRAWDLWFHGAFASLRGLGSAGAARAVLLEHVEELPAVLAAVRRLGALERLLDLVDDGATLERLLEAAGPPARRPEDDPAYPLLVTAARLADRLALWRAARPGFAALWRAQCDAGVPPASWRDHRALSAALAGMLDAFRRAGHLRAGPVDPAALAGALRELDWLDPAPIASVLAPADEPRLPALARPRATAGQRRLVAMLAARLRDGALQFRGAPHADVLRALAALDPGVAGDPATRQLVERLLAAGALLRADAIAPLAAGHAEGALAVLGPAEQQAAAGAYRLLARLGPDAVAVAMAAGPAAAGAPPASIHSACAGSALLLRAAADVRLPRLVERAGIPGAGAVLLSLLLRWSGPAAVDAGRVDPGLALLAGSALSIEELRSAWRAMPPQAFDRLRDELGEWLELREADVWHDGLLGLPAVDHLVGVAAGALLRSWAAWLRGFGAASAPFLLEQLVRRPGTVARVGDDVLVRLERRPLDVVLRVGALADDLDLRPLDRTGRLRFALEPT